MPQWLPRGRSILFPCARHGLYHGWKALKARPGDAVLVPAFVCDTVTGPLLKAGARPVFINVHGDVSVDWDDARRKLRAGGRVRALVWYHYLGLPFGVDDALGFCREHGIALIEDCAHALFSRHRGRPAGSFGDIAVFSIRKTLPVLNAGAMVINNRALLPLPRCPRRNPGAAYERLLREREIALSRLQLLALPGSEGLNREFGRQWLARLRRLDSPRKAVRDHARREMHHADRFHRQMARTLPLDSLSMRVMRNADSEKIRRVRARNWRIYAGCLSEIALATRLSPGASPMGFSIRVVGRNAFRQRLAARRVEAYVHWPEWLLPRGVSGRFPAAKRLADTLLTLPCHQDLTVADVKHVCRAVRSAL